MLSYHTSEGFGDFQSKFMSEINDNQAFGKPSQALIKYYMTSDSKKASLSLHNNDRFTPSSHSFSEKPSQNYNGKQSFYPPNKVSFASKSTSYSSESLSSGSTDDNTTGANFLHEQTNIENLPQKSSEAQDKKKKKCLKKVSYKKKFKTEMCKFWAETGGCQFGDNCAFAHGKDQMQEKVHTASNYKSKLCAQFQENGFCVYGLRCHFVHCLRQDIKLNSALGEESYARDLENIEFWCNTENDCICKRRKNRVRLPCFSKFENN